jgi:hypothetical protein
MKQRKRKSNDFLNIPLQSSVFAVKLSPYLFAVQLALHLLYITVKSTSMVLWNFLNFAVCTNVHYIWHWMVLFMVLPNGYKSVKKLSTMSTIIWRNEKIFSFVIMCSGTTFSFKWLGIV